MSTSSSRQSPNLYGPPLEIAKANLQGASLHAALDVYKFSTFRASFFAGRLQKSGHAESFGLIASSSPDWPRLEAVCSPTTFITLQRQSWLRRSSISACSPCRNHPETNHMPETSQGPASGPAGHESAAMLLRNDMCHTAEICPDPIILMPSHTAISRVLAVESSGV